MLTADSMLSHSDLASMITLSLCDETGEHKLTKDSYTLGELNDLESRLVLITDSESTYKLEVDLFLKVSEEGGRVQYVRC